MSDTEKTVKEKLAHVFMDELHGTPVGDIHDVAMRIGMSDWQVRLRRILEPLFLQSHIELENTLRGRIVVRGQAHLLICRALGCPEVYANRQRG